MNFLNSEGLSRVQTHIQTALDMKADKLLVEKQFTDSVADWNQNDEFAHDYVKNRTHYESKELIDYKPNVSITTDDTGFFSASSGEEKIAILKGEYYIIVFDGVKYELTPNNLYMLGNASLISNEYEDTGEPFCFHNTYETVDYRFKAPGTHSFEYSRFITSIQTLDEKYIPDTIARKEFVETEVAALVGSAPETLDTIEELATALNNNKDIVTVLNDSIVTKANKTDVYTKAEVDAAIAAAIEVAFANIARAENAAF